MVTEETGHGAGGGGALSKLQDLAKAKPWSQKSGIIIWDRMWGSLGQAGLVQVGVRVERALNDKMRSWEFIASNESR